MSAMPGENVEAFSTAVSFEQVTSVVASEFRVQEALMDNGVPTYYLAQPQETKQAFLRLLEKLRPMNLIALLRRVGDRIVLRVVLKPTVKPSNPLINWALFLATIATTFVTGYMLSPKEVNPFIGGVSFTIAVMAVLGIHEMGHKITANRRGIEATLPYFIPGPPPVVGGFGTFGAVIMQKSLPSNKDALFDVGADGPIAGFIIAVIVSIVGLMLLIPGPSISNASSIGVPIMWKILELILRRLNLFPRVPQSAIATTLTLRSVSSKIKYVLYLNPVAFAGWVGMLVTTLNLLPVAMLDGGHVMRSVLGENRDFRLALAAISVVYLFIEGLIPMAFLVVLMLSFKHPGPLDDVSSLSSSRKLVAIGLVVMFILCAVPFTPI